MITTPAWKKIPDMPGIYWCNGKGKLSIIYEVSRVVKQDGRLYALFPGKEKMIAVDALTNHVENWWGPITLADFQSCLIFESGFYQKGQNPQEPIKKERKNARRRKNTRKSD